MDTFYITISNGLLRDGHRKKMGSAVWEFMWCIDRITKIDNYGVGWVLGGKPIQLLEMADGVDEDTVSRNLIKLEKEGYIKRIRTPYGLSLRVMKSKKTFRNNAVSNRGNAESLRENAVSNKTVTVDNTVDNHAPEARVVGKMKVKDLETIEKFSLKAYFKRMEEDPRRAIQIIGHYFEKKNLKFDSVDEIRAGIKRHLRAANEVAKFSDDKIIKATEKAEREYGEKYTVDTILKMLTR